MKVLIKERLSANKYIDSSGYLICKDAILARTGKQEYLKSEVFADAYDSDEIINIDRPEKEVFSDATLASFENKPVTCEHPSTDVNPGNYRDLAVGFVRDVKRGTFEGQPVILGTLVITDENIIRDIQNGIRTELSCGYDCDIVDGVDGYCQSNIRGNHVALCEQGRAGIAKIVDSKVEDAFTEKDLEETAIYKNGEHCIQIKMLGKNDAMVDYFDWSKQFGKDYAMKNKRVKYEELLETLNRGFRKVNSYKDSIVDNKTTDSLESDVERAIDHFENGIKVKEHAEFDKVRKIAEKNGVGVEYNDRTHYVKFIYRDSINDGGNLYDLTYDIINGYVKKGYDTDQTLKYLYKKLPDASVSNIREIYSELTYRVLSENTIRKYGFKDSINDESVTWDDIEDALPNSDVNYIVAKMENSDFDTPEQVRKYAEKYFDLTREEKQELEKQIKKIFALDGINDKGMPRGQSDLDRDMYNWLSTQKGIIPYKKDVYGYSVDARALDKIKKQFIKEMYGFKGDIYEFDSQYRPTLSLTRALFKAIDKVDESVKTYSDSINDDYKGYSIEANKDGNEYHVIKNGKVVAKVPTEKEAREWIDENTNNSEKEINSSSNGDRVRDNDNGYVLVLRDRWEKYGINANIHSVCNSKSEAERRKTSLSNSDHKNYVVVDCNNKKYKVIDSREGEQMKDAVMPSELIGFLRNISLNEGDIKDYGNQNRGLYIQLQNHGSSVYEDPKFFKHVSPKQESKCWIRIWNNGKLVFNTSEPLNVAKVNAIKFLQNYTMNDSIMNNNNVVEDASSFMEQMKKEQEQQLSKWGKKEADIWRKTDWKARNYKPLLVPSDSFTKDVKVTSGAPDTVLKNVKFVLEINPNPIFPPRYVPQEEFGKYKDFAWVYDGNKKNGYIVIDRADTWKAFNSVSWDSAQKLNDKKFGLFVLANEVDKDDINKAKSFGLTYELVRGNYLFKGEAKDLAKFQAYCSGRPCDELDIIQAAGKPYSIVRELDSIKDSNQNEDEIIKYLEGKGYGKDIKSGLIEVLESNNRSVKIEALSKDIPNLRKELEKEYTCEEVNSNMLRVYVDSAIRDSYNVNNTYWVGKGKYQKELDWLEKHDLHPKHAYQYYRMYNDGDFPTGMGAEKIMRRTDWNYWQRNYKFVPEAAIKAMENVKEYVETVLDQEILKEYNNNKNMYNDSKIAKIALIAGKFIKAKKDSKVNDVRSEQELKGMFRWWDPAMRVNEDGSVEVREEDKEKFISECKERGYSKYLAIVSAKHPGFVRFKVVDSKIKDNYIFKNVYQYDILDENWKRFSDYCKQNNINIFAGDDLEIYTDDPNHIMKIASILKLPQGKFKKINSKDSETKDASVSKPLKVKYGKPSFFNKKYYVVGSEEEGDIHDNLPSLAEAKKQLKELRRFDKEEGLGATYYINEAYETDNEVYYNEIYHD